MNLGICRASPEALLLAYTKYGSRERIGLGIRHLALLFGAYAISSMYQNAGGIRSAISYSSSGSDNGAGYLKISSLAFIFYGL